MLCGAAVQSFADRRFRPIPYSRLLLVLGGAMVLVAQINTLGSWIGWPMFLGSMAVILVFAAPHIPWLPRLGIDAETGTRLGTAALIVIVLLLPTGWSAISTVLDPESPTPEPGSDSINVKFLGKDEFTSDTINRVLSNSEPGTAAEFLQQQYIAEGPFRYTSYLGAGYPDVSYRWVYDTFWWHRMQPNVVGLLVNARTLYLGLEQSSGYNPVQLDAYARYIDTMNGARQDYHWLDTLAPALTSSNNQLLDMMNVRYILVDGSIPVTREDHAAIAENFEEVFRDPYVIVYENTSAFPRAWLVHQVEADANDTGIVLLDSTYADGHTIAFIDEEVPESLQATTEAEQLPTANESVVTTASLDGEMRFNVTAEHPALVVVSSTWADGWHAYVNGRETPLYRTNTAMMGVPVNAGSAVMELRYEPPSMEIGLYISLASMAVMAGLCVASAVTADRGRDRSQGTIEEGFA
jgi:hypothetical protein